VASKAAFAAAERPAPVTPKAAFAAAEQPALQAADSPSAWPESSSRAHAFMQAGMTPAECKGGCERKSKSESLFLFLSLFV
jgi:hypothetical protein